MRLALDAFGGFDFLRDKKILVTGATGLIGSCLVDLLLFLNESENLNLKILTAGRNREKIEARFGIFADAPYFSFVEYDAEKNLQIEEKIDFAVHAASPATPTMFSQKPVETIFANVFGVKNLLEKCAKDKARLLFVSSSEVYGKSCDAPFREDACGKIDFLNPRACYGQSKRLAETLCTSFAAEYGTDFVVARPGHIFGPTAQKSDNRVGSAFLFTAADGKNIVLKSDGTQIRSWVYCVDCATALLAILQKGESGAAYNIANKKSAASIRDFAKKAASAAGVQVEFAAAKESEKSAFNPMANSTLDATRLESLGWHAKFNLQEGIERTLKILQEIKE